ncbi:hypothetical protein [Roseisolibacter agri]|uniref:Uncharacterized protein n=1 Tax=Roseisolibacter agri TaxID=2014610 RepID=A0AA37V281_9BACT|nr:hypothetical protein [Roseisolibacter agri]GLC24867.1 hypothetical protein rosag_13800 [Roseisolibacter agri]
MAVGEGRFVLYTRIEPPLEAGDYRLTARQVLAASGPDGPLDEDDLRVAALPTHFRVRAPRYQLPPDQVLSTYPPANSEGAFGMRLPQVVIKRRTLPWERLLSPTRRGTPWLALVLVAEGEAELRMNEKVADCVTPGVVLDGLPDVEVGNTLVVQRSVVHRIFPTQLDVPLLAHAREVDIHDTELMMGDDDGFLAVVISNRLPLPGKDARGDEAPVKYLACLVNLEGQFDRLLERAPDPSPFTVRPLVLANAVMSVAASDHLAMGASPVSPPAGVGPFLGGLAVAGGLAAAEEASAAEAALAAAAIDGATVIRPRTVTHDDVGTTGTRSDWSRADVRAGSDVYVDMARPFSRADRFDPSVVLDPTYRFPVLLHWSFTSTGSTTFRTLMEHLDSGLLGTLPEVPAGEEPPRLEGRPPLEIVETGHVGLVHRTRRGDEARIWYRGPFVAHPTVDPPEGRLALAHAADQLRIVVPDGREDLSLAGAFEIGRLMALARPSIVAALLRWRQVHYQSARRQAIWDAQRPFLVALLGAALPERIPVDFGVHLGRALAGAIAARPETFVGAPRPLVDAGRPLSVDASTIEALAAGYALPPAVLRGDLPTVLGRLRATAPEAAPIPSAVGIDRVTGGNGRNGVKRTARTAATRAAERAAQLERDTLVAALDAQVAQLAADTLAHELRAAAYARRGRGATKAAAAAAAPDALDRLIDALGGFAPDDNDDA